MQKKRTDFAGNTSRRKRRISLERLEDRRLLAADLLYHNGLHMTPLASDTPEVDPQLLPGGLTYEQAFNLQSKPDSNFTIYLDFDGHVTEDTQWNLSYGIDSIETLPFDLDGDTTSFSQAELDRIITSWQQSAEDFAPFDVNVTTRDPGVDALTNSGGGDMTWGARVIITDDTFAACGCGGFAFLDSFDINDTPTFAFNHGPGVMGETISHEVGHMLGLSHDGDSGEYYFGHGEGTTSWGAIMGAAFTPNVTQWSRGQYFDASNTFDNDLQVITSQNGFGYRTDDYGNSIANADELNVAGGNTINEFGIIERTNDVDYFSFETGGGQVSLSVNPLGVRPNLDAFVALYDSAGNVVDFDIPQGEVIASIEDVNVSAGTYFVRVEGVGSHDSFNPNTNRVVGPNPQPWFNSNPEGYNDYGSLGQYLISGTIVPPTSNLISIQATDAEKVEGPAGTTTDLTFTVTRSGNTTTTTTVDYSVVDNLPAFVGANYETQASSSDFVAGTLLSGTVNFAANETTKTLTFTVRGDATTEDDEYFDVLLSNQSVNWEFEDSRATGIILTDEGSVGFSSIGATDSVFEGPFDGAFVRFRQLGAANGEFDEWALDNVSLEGSDWVDDFEPDIDNAVWSSVTNAEVNMNFGGSGHSLFFSGEPNRTAVSQLQNAQPGDTLTFDIIFGDSTNGGENVDPGEDVVVEYSLDGGSNWLLIDTVDSQTNKVWTTIDVDLPTGIDTNPDSAVSFEVLRQGAQNLTTTVDWEVVGVTADVDDFVGATLPSGTVTLGSGESSKRISIPISPDAIGEPDEVFEVRLTSTTGDGAVILGETTVALGTILNDDPNYVINAGPQFRWRQLDNSDGDFDHWGIDNVMLSSGEFGDDFDPSIDQAEWVEISGGTARDDFDGSQGNALYFTGDDPRFAVSRFTSPSPGDVLSFDIIYGSDFNGGENPEEGEEVVLEISTDGSNWTELAEYPLNLTNWTTREISVPGGSDVDQLEGDSGTTDYVFTVSRDVSNFAASVDWEIVGSGASPANAADFATGILPSGTVTFNSGETQQTITVQVAGDSIFEADETFDLVLIGTGISETATIINDDEGGGSSGDFNADGNYDCDDVDALVAAIAGNTGELLYDLNGDSTVDSADLDLWLVEAGAANNASGGAYLGGDANLDGAVDVLDFNVWNSSKFTTTAAWCNGDFNADGVVDVLDFNVWNTNKFQLSDSASSPTGQSTTSGFVLANQSTATAAGRTYSVRDAVFSNYEDDNSSRG